jgi:hypothetical protein
MNELNIALSTGLTVTAQVYTAGAASGSPISLSEVGTSGFYTGNMAGSAGTYQLVFLSGGATVGTGQINWSGTAEVPVSTLTTADIPSAAISAIQAKTDNLPSDPADQSLVEEAITALSIPTVVQIRSELDSNSTKLANLDATVSSRLAPSGTLATVTTLTNAPTVPSAASIRAEIDSNSTQLAAIKSKTDALPVSPAATGDIPTADITAIKGKTDLLETTRLAQCSTVATTGAQLAAALS